MKKKIINFTSNTLIFTISFILSVAILLLPENYISGVGFLRYWPVVPMFTFYNMIKGALNYYKEDKIDGLRFYTGMFIGSVHVFSQTFKSLKEFYQIIGSFMYFPFLLPYLLTFIVSALGIYVSGFIKVNGEFRVVHMFETIKGRFAKERPNISLKELNEKVAQSTREKSEVLSRPSLATVQTQSDNPKSIEELIDDISIDVDFSLSRKEFEYKVLNDRFKPGTLLTVNRELNSRNRERIVGAAISMNGRRLIRHKNAIKSRKIVRDGNALKSADVPGYSFLAGRYNRYENGRMVYYWHRTHLIPFRHTLSEGDTLANTVFAGTAHLNSGNRPQIPYKVQPGSALSHSRDSRKNQLLEKFTKSEKLPRKDILEKDYAAGENVFEKYYGKPVNANKLQVPGAPNESFYSLDDVEQTVDIIMEENPNNNYLYGTLLNYQNETDVSPKTVDAFLIDKSNNQMVFQIKLLNNL